MRGREGGAIKIHRVHTEELRWTSSLVKVHCEHTEELTAKMAMLTNAAVQPERGDVAYKISLLAQVAQKTLICISGLSDGYRTVICLT